jgi:hypothetical protein
MSAPPSPRGLLNIENFVVTKQVLSETIAFLRAVGMKGAEGFVVWTGKSHVGNSFRFSTAVVPEQRALSTERGLLVVVSGDALFAVNKLAHDRGEILGGQVHTHPTSAYHSETDDHYPLVTLVGALSVVVPNFARDAPDDISTWAWYRLAQHGRWQPLSHRTKVSFE